MVVMVVLVAQAAALEHRDAMEHLNYGFVGLLLPRFMEERTPCRLVHGNDSGYTSVDFSRV